MKLWRAVMLSVIWQKANSMLQNWAVVLLWDCWKHSLKSTSISEGLESGSVVMLLSLILREVFFVSSTGSPRTS